MQIICNVKYKKYVIMQAKSKDRQTIVKSFDGRAPPRPAEKLTVFPQTP